MNSFCPTARVGLQIHCSILNLKKMKILKISLSVFFLSIFLYSCEPEELPLQETSFPTINGDTGDQEDPIEERKG